MPVAAKPPGVAVEIRAIGSDHLLEVLRCAPDFLLLSRLDTGPRPILTAQCKKSALPPVPACWRCPSKEIGPRAVSSGQLLKTPKEILMTRSLATATLAAA